MKVYWRTRRILRSALLLICFSPAAYGDQMLRTDRSVLQHATPILTTDNGTLEVTISSYSTSVPPTVSYWNLREAPSVAHIHFGHAWQQQRDPQTHPCCASGIKGKVLLLGPTCPVVTVPPNPNCDDKPYQVQIVVKSDSQKRDGGDAGKEVARFRSSSKGEFRVCLPPGTYLLESASTGVATLSFMRPQWVKVEPNKFATITIHIDSGIR